MSAQTTIWAKASLPHTRISGLSLALSVPATELNASIDAQFKRALTVMISLAIIIFIAAALLGEFAVRRQAARLMSSISRIDAGDYSLSLAATRNYPRGELGQVMQALYDQGLEMLRIFTE